MSGFERGDVARALAVFPKLEAEAAKGIADALDKGAAEIAIRAKILAPVDTGDLREAIQVRDSLDGFKGTGAIGNFARMVKGEAGGLTRFIGVFPRKRGDPGWYAAWVEFGTSERFTKTGKSRGIGKAQPFLGPAFFGGRKRVTGRVKRALTKAAKAAAGARR